MGDMIEVVLMRGLAGKSRRQRATARSLGLRKPRQRVVHRDNPMIRGMIRKVEHLVEVRELED